MKRTKNTIRKKYSSQKKNAVARCRWHNGTRIFSCSLRSVYIIHLAFLHLHEYDEEYVQVRWIRKRWRNKEQQRYCFFLFCGNVFVCNVMYVICNPSGSFFPHRQISISSHAKIFKKKLLLYSLAFLSLLLNVWFTI